MDSKQIRPDSSHSTRPSLADVARAAGCSVSAASLVLTGKHEGRISSHLTERILEAAKEVHYRPNRAAQQLATGMSDIVVAVVPDPGNPFYARLLSALAEGLGEKHQLSLVMPTATESLATAAQRALAFDPAIVVVSSPPYGFSCASADVPILLLDAGGMETGSSRVDIDVAQYGRIVGEHLVQLGHHRIGWFGLDRPVPSLELRRQALSQTLLESGAQIAASHGFSGIDPTVAASVFRDSWPRWRTDGITALVCGDDLLAYGALLGAKTLGVAIPDDLSIVGAGDLWYSEWTTPPLTTINLRADDLGREAASAVLSWLETGGAPASTCLSVNLVLRNSTGPSLSNAGG